MPVLLKAEERWKLQPKEYIDILRNAIFLLTKDLGKKGYLSTPSQAGRGRRGWADFGRRRRWCIITLKPGTVSATRPNHCPALSPLPGGNVFVDSGPQEKADRSHQYGQRTINNDPAVPVQGDGLHSQTADNGEEKIDHR